MDRVKHRTHTRKAGMQVPKHVLRELSRRHPTVTIAWAHQTKQWVLIHNDKLGSQFVHAFSGLPTYANTIKVLDAAHHSQWTNETAVERKLAALDDSHINPAEESNRRDMLREGHNEMFNQLTNRKVISIKS